MRKPQIAEQLWSQSAQGFFEKNSGSVQGQELLNQQDQLAKSLKQTEVYNDLKAITNSVRDSLKNSKLAELNPEVGGQYSKEGIELNTSLFSDMTEETRARINHVFAHENNTKIKMMKIHFSC